MAPLLPSTPTHDAVCIKSWVVHLTLEAMQGAGDPLSPNKKKRKKTQMTMTTMTSGKKLPEAEHQY
jgi:hypothetical protein